MVSTLSIAFMIITLLVAFGLPIGLAIYFRKKEKIMISPIFIGALIFLIFQVALRIPMLELLQKQSWFSGLLGNVAFVAVFYSLTAGIFEEVGRFLAFKFFMNKDLNRPNGIAYGIGHGGIEAIIFLGIAGINNLIYALLINMGKLDFLLAGKVPAETLELIKNTYLSTPYYMYAYGAIERVFAITIHIALSLLVLYGVMNKKNIYLLYAILCHTLINIPAVVLTQMGYNPAISEAVICVFAIIAFIFIKKTKSIFSKEQELSLPEEQRNTIY